MNYDKDRLQAIQTENQSPLNRMAKRFLQAPDPAMLHVLNLLRQEGGDVIEEKFPPTAPAFLDWEWLDRQVDVMNRQWRPAAVMRVLEEQGVEAKLVSREKTAANAAFPLVDALIRWWEETNPGVFRGLD